MFLNFEFAFRRFQSFILWHKAIWSCVGVSPMIVDSDPALVGKQLKSGIRLRHKKRKHSGKRSACPHQQRFQLSGLILRTKVSQSR